MPPTTPTGRPRPSTLPCMAPNRSVFCLLTFQFVKDFINSLIHFLSTRLKSGTAISIKCQSFVTSWAKDIFRFVMGVMSIFEYFMSIFEYSPRKWPKTHAQKLFLSIFELWQNSILSRCSTITSTSKYTTHYTFKCKVTRPPLRALINH